MVKVQRIIVPNTGERSWVLFDAEHQPLIASNQYLSYASSQFNWQQITVRHDDQYNPRCGWFLLRISGQAWC